MAFRFTLEFLLRLRRSERRQQELLLQKDSEQVNRMVREVEGIESEVRQIVSESRSTDAGTAAEILFDQSRCQVLDVRRVQVEQRLQAAREQHTLSTAGFQRAWQRSEALEALRERERKFY